MLRIMCVDIWIGYLLIVLTTTLLLSPHLEGALRTMLAFSQKLFIPVVYLFITTSSLVQSHELAFNRRDHGSKRFLKNRTLPFPPIINVAALPSASSDSQIVTPTVSQSTASDTSPQTTSSIVSTPVVSVPTSSSASTSTSSQSTSSSKPSSASSSAPTSVSSSSTSISQTSPSSNLDPVPVAPTANVVASTITSTQSVSATPTDTAVPQVQSASSKTKTTTVTALIAIAASVGGIAILWTIFRKWKLSSSKEFDRRLNPITDWQPTNGEDDVPALRRAPSSSSSFHSGGGGSANGHSAGIAPLDHDFTAGPGNSAPIGGYADLARASSPNPPMQQALGSGPSFNHGYGVPLHHQTRYSSYDAYDYNGGNARY